MKVLVLGIGNILFGDEGVGAHLAHLFAKKYRFHSGIHEISILDGGTLGHFLIPTIVAHDIVFILDCIHVGDDSCIGDVYAFSFRDVPLNVTWQGSAHEVEMLQTLKMTEINGDLPDVRIIGIVPEVVKTDMTFTLSAAVLKGVQVMESLLLQALEELHIHAEVVHDYTIEELAQTTFRGF